MNRLIAFLLFFLLQTFTAQSKLVGKWIVDFTTQMDGSYLPINDPEFSAFGEYTFSDDKVRINSIEIAYSVSGKKIITKGNTYEFQYIEDYLILKSPLNKTITYLLRPDDFIKKYPEFQPETVFVDGKEIFKANDVYRADYLKPETFQMDLMKDLSLINSSKLISLQLQFVVTKDSKTRNVEITESKNPEVNQHVINFIKFSRSFRNTTGTDVFYSCPILFAFVDDGISMNFQDDKSSKEKDDNSSKNRKALSEFSKTIQKADSFYSKNEFAKAVELYEKALEIKSFEKIPNLSIKSGIAYLALEKREKACEKFENAGGMKSFASRNYYRVFCSEKK